MQTQTDAGTPRTLTPSDRHAMLMALGRFAEQRPGLEPMNYGDRRSYDNERRAILTDLQHARRLLAAVERRAGIGPDEILAACRSAYSGRLTLVERNGAWASITARGSTGRPNTGWPSARSWHRRCGHTCGIPACLRPWRGRYANTRARIRL